MSNQSKKIINHIKSLLDQYQFVTKYISSKKFSNEKSKNAADKYNALIMNNEHFTEIAKNLAIIAVIQVRSNHRDLDLIKYIKDILITFKLKIDEIGINSKDIQSLKDILLEK